MQNSVALVVSHNGENFLKRCLPNILGQTKPFTSIVVVDNGSNDQTSEILARHFPSVQKLHLKHNAGFSGGVNYGLDHILQEQRFSFVALINNDVYIEPEWHENALAILAADHTIGSCAPCLLQESQQNVVDTCGIAWNESGAENYLNGEEAPSPDSPHHEIFGPSAAAALYRITVFEQVGLFDTSLFAYQEDVDFALRARTAGWRCIFVPSSRGVHTGHGSNRQFPINGSYADFYNARNRLAVLVASLPAIGWRRHWSAILFNELSSLSKSFVEGRASAVLSGFGCGVLRIPIILWRRLRNKDKS